MNDYDGDNIGICAQCGEYTINNAELCSSCHTQRQIDNSDWTPIMCPNCKSILVVQNDWRKPIYDCQICGHHFEDAEGVWVDDPDDGLMSDSGGPEPNMHEF